MKLEHALFLAIVCAILASRCVFYWAGRFGQILSLPGLVLMTVVFFTAICLFLLFGPESMLVPVSLVYMAFVAITTIGIWITGE